MLIRGLLNSASIMLYTFAILFLVLFIFSSVAIELITKNSNADEDPEFGRIVDLHFNTVPNTMLTLLQFACMDRIAEIYRPLIKQDGWLAIYFVFVIITCMVLASLIGAVIFSTTMAENDAEQDVAKKIQEKKWSALFGDMRGLFVRLDSDKTGVLSRENIINMGEEDQAILSDALGETEKAAMYKKLDREKKGYITINEFYDRILETTMNQGAIGLTRMERQIESMHWRTKEMFSAQHDLHLLLRQIICMIEGLSPSLEEQTHHVQAKETMRRMSASGGESIFAIADARKLSVPAAVFSAPETRRSSLVEAQVLADVLKTVESNGHAPALGMKDKVQSTTPDWAIGILDSLANIWQDLTRDIMNHTRDHLETVAKVRTKKTGKFSPDCKAFPRDPNAKKRLKSPGSDCPSVGSRDSSFSELMRATKHGPLQPDSDVLPTTPLKGTGISHEPTTDSRISAELTNATSSTMAQEGVVKI